MKNAISAEERAAYFAKLVSTHSDVMLKGATMPYTSVNGNMFSYLSKDGFLALRLPQTTRTEFIKKYKTTLVTAYGIIQKEYVVVPDSLLEKTTELKPYFAASVDYAKTLKPKATKKAAADATKKSPMKAVKKVAKSPAKKAKK